MLFKQLLLTWCSDEYKYYSDWLAKALQNVKEIRFEHGGMAYLPLIHCADRITNVSFTIEKT